MKKNSQGKKLISLALIFALLISIFSALPLSASAADTKAIYIFGNHDLFQEKGINKVKFTNMTAIFYDFVCSYDAQYLYEDKNFNDVYKVEIPVDLTDNFLFNLFGENDYDAGAEFTADEFNEENNAVHFTSIGDLSIDTQAIIQYYDVEENYPNETTTLTEVPTTTNPTEATTTTEPTEAPATTKPETTQPATEATQPSTTNPEATEPGTSTKTIYIYGPQSQFQNNNIVNFKVINTSKATPPNLNEEDIIATYDAPFLYTDKWNQDVFSFEFPLDAEGYLWFQGLDSDSNVVFQYFNYNFLNWIKTDACNAIYFSMISSHEVHSEGTYYDAQANLPDATEAPSTETPATTAASETTAAAEPTEATTAAPETTTPVQTVEVLLGDADGSGKIDVKDVTYIQKHIASYFTLEGTPALAADVDGNGTIDVNDATLIQKYLASYNVDYKIGEVVQLGSDTPAPTEENPQPTEVQPTTAAAQPTDSPEPTTAAAPDEPESSKGINPPQGEITFYVPNYVDWLDNDGCKLWIYNEDTDEVRVAQEYNSNDEGIVGYFYFYIPENWVNLSIYRTAYNIEKDAFDRTSKYDVTTNPGGIVINQWEKIGDRGENIAYRITADGKGEYDTFNPQEPKPDETERTIYFDNRQTQWTGVYIYGWAFGLSEEPLEMELVGDNIWAYTFYDELPIDKTEGFIFVNSGGVVKGDSGSWSNVKQTVDLATEAGKNLFVPTPGNGKLSGTWDVYTP